MFPSIAGTGFDGATLADRLLHEAGVCVLAGTAFGTEGRQHIRISYANSRENLTEALRRIDAFVREHAGTGATTSGASTSGASTSGASTTGPRA